MLIVAWAFLLVTTVIAQAKRDWQDGTWRDTDRVEKLVGALSNETFTGEVTGTRISGDSDGLTTPLYRVSQVFVIETADRWYVASQRLRWRWSKQVPMTINAAVRFAVEKDKLYVVGEDKKEYELTITEKGIKVSK